MQVTDTGIDWFELVYDLVLTMGGFFLTITGVIVVLGWIAYGLRIPE